jgi:hypothetical protein
VVADQPEHVVITVNQALHQAGKQQRSTISNIATSGPESSGTVPDPVDMPA